MAAAGVAGAPLSLTGAHAANAAASAVAEPVSVEPWLALPAATDDVTPFRLRVSTGALVDLRRRLVQARFPERETVPDGSQGAQLERVRRLVDHWRTRYDWRRVEARLNRFGQFRTRLDGLGFHFLHVRSRHADAVPLLLTHGWPGSVVEFLDVIEPLTNPLAHGGTAADAFHVVVPSLPGYGFSDKPTTPGWHLGRVARAWADLMPRLGYRRYLAQGGDWGALVSQELAKLGPAELAGIHLNFFTVFPPPVGTPPTPEEQEALRKLELFQTDGFGYFSIQSTRPQTIGYALADSPVGQAAWIYEKFTAWTDSGGEPERVLGLDRMLDAIMLYWLPGTGASAARFYWENTHGGPGEGEVKVPVGFTVFPGEVVPTPRVWAERGYGRNLVYFNRVDSGGHFAAFEQPEVFTEELRRFGRLFR